MRVAFERVYQKAERHAAATSAALTELSTSTAPLTSTSGAPNTASPAITSTSQRCRTWSYYDAASSETCLVTMKEHTSLRVQVEKEDSSVGPKSGDTLRQGLCGVSWELLWFPKPSPVSPASPVSLSDVNGELQPIEPSTPVEASFFYSRSTALSLATQQGHGGVVFLSSRLLLIATNEEIVDDVGAAHVELFFLQHDALNESELAWRRMPEAVRLPWKDHRSAEATVQRHKKQQQRPSLPAYHPRLLLCTGVSSPLQSVEGKREVSKRILYIVAACPEQNETGPWTVSVGVIDILVRSEASTLSPTAAGFHVGTQLIHLFTEPRFRLDSLGSYSGADGGEEHTWIPADLLWAFIDGYAEGGSFNSGDTTLYGNLIALLPTYDSLSPLSDDPNVPSTLIRKGRSTVVKGVASLFVTPGGATSTRQQQKQQPHHAVPILHQCRYGPSEYGVLSVSEGRFTTSPSSALTDTCNGIAAQQVLAQLLASQDVETCVYDISIGPPLQRVASEVAESRSPGEEPSSVLMVCTNFIAPRVGCRAATSLKHPPGIYQTSTVPWSCVAAEASKLARVQSASLSPHGGVLAARMIPLAKAVWVANDPPLVLSRINQQWVPPQFTNCVNFPWDAWSRTTNSKDGSPLGGDEEDPPPYITIVESCQQRHRLVCIPQWYHLTREWTLWYVQVRGSKELAAFPSSKPLSQVASMQPDWQVVSRLTDPSCSTPEERSLQMKRERCRVVEWATQQLLQVDSYEEGSEMVRSLPTQGMRDTKVPCSAPLTYSPSLIRRTSELVRFLLSYASVMAHVLTLPMDGDSVKRGNPLPQRRWLAALLQVVATSPPTQPNQPDREYHVYACAVRSIVLATVGEGALSANAAAAEEAHLLKTAEFFLGLMLDTLIQVDWLASGTAARQLECLFLIFIGAVPTAHRSISHGPLKSSEVLGGLTIAEGRAVHVLLHLGALNNTEDFTWLRKIILLYVCRRRDVPLELVFEDVCIAAALPTGSCFFSLDSQNGGGSGVTLAAADANRRQLMELALLRIVDAHMLFRWVNTVAAVVGTSATGTSVSTGNCSSPKTGKPVSLTDIGGGLLSAADLYTLCCTWPPESVAEAAAPGFTFVGFLMSLMVELQHQCYGAKSGTPHSLFNAAAIEELVVKALDSWEYGLPPGMAEMVSSGEATKLERHIVFPVLDNYFVAPKEDDQVRCNSVVIDAVVMPYPCYALPPLMTVYAVYHVMQRIVAALGGTAFFKAQHKNSHLHTTHHDAAAAVDETSTEEEEDVDSQRWRRLARLHCGALQDLYAGSCVVRFLVKDNMRCAEELFTAITIAHQGSPASPATQQSGRTSMLPHEAQRRFGWMASYFSMWGSLLYMPLATPLMGAAATAYLHKICRASPTWQRCARVLHYVYAGAGTHSLRVLISQALGFSSTRDSEVSNRESIATRLEDLVKMVQKRDDFPQVSHQQTASVVGQTSPLSTWLISVWVNVLLCDFTAITNVGLFENLFTAMAHLVQDSRCGRDGSGSGNANQKGGSAVPQCVVDLCFALLRPCFLYAYPTVQQMALVEELHHGGNGSPAVTTSLQTYPQHNETLLWNPQLAQHHHEPSAHQPTLKEAALAAPASARCRVVASVEYRSSGEVCEQLQRQLSSMAGLLKDTSPMFVCLSQLISLHPSLVDLMPSQRSLQRFYAGQTLSYVAEPVLPNFYLSMPSLYAAAVVVRQFTTGELHCADSTSSLTKPVGWLIILYEVLRRELHTYVTTNLLVCGYIQAEEHHPGAVDVVKPTTGALQPHHWHLIATEVHMKEFLNALADGVEPCTQVLHDHAIPLAEPVILFMLMDVLQGLLYCDSVDWDSDANHGNDTQSSVRPVIRCSLSFLRELKGCIRSVVQPMYSALSRSDQCLLHRLVSPFFEKEYLAAVQSSPAGELLLHHQPPDSPAAIPSEIYQASALHQKWTQWLDTAVGRSSSVFSRWHHVAGMEGELSKLNARQLLLPSVRTDYQCLVGPIASPGNLHPSSTSPTTQKTASQPVMDSSCPGPRPLFSYATSSLMESGVSLRASVLRSITATVAPPPPSRSSGGSKSTVQVPPSSSPLLSTLYREDAVWLVKEEGYKRRQIAEQLILDQNEFFQSPSFHAKLMQLYLALRCERRRNEIYSFAIDEKDIIFTGEMRAQQLLIESCRKITRLKWKEVLERQRTAIHLLCFQEKESRIGVEASYYAGLTDLKAEESTHQAFRKLQERLRHDICNAEENEWDTLREKAARDHLHITKLLVEQAEEAEWQLEDEEWARQQQEVEEVPLYRSKSRSSRLPLPSPPLTKTLESQKIQANCIGLPITATPAKPPSPPAPLPLHHMKPPVQDTKQTLFNTLARWQTKIRDTVAPPPPHVSAPPLPTKIECPEDTIRSIPQHTPTPPAPARNASSSWGDGFDDSDEAAEAPQVPLGPTEKAAAVEARRESVGHAPSVVKPRAPTCEEKRVFVPVRGADGLASLGEAETAVEGGTTFVPQETMRRKRKKNKALSAVPIEIASLGTSALEGKAPLSKDGEVVAVSSALSPISGKDAPLLNHPAPLSTPALFATPTFANDGHPQDEEVLTTARSILPAFEAEVHAPTIFNVDDVWNGCSCKGSYEKNAEEGNSQRTGCSGNRVFAPQLGEGRESRLASPGIAAISSTSPPKGNIEASDISAQGRSSSWSFSTSLQKEANVAEVEKECMTYNAAGPTALQWRTVYAEEERYRVQLVNLL